MASDALITSRRTMLGAFAALPFIAIPVAAVAITSHRAEWDAAMADMERKRLAFDRADAAWVRDDIGASKHVDRLCTLYCEADDKLMAMPAPDGQALMWKLNKVFEDDGDKDGMTISWSRDYLAQTIRDCHRLLGA